MNIERRIERAERYVGVKEEDQPAIIISVEYGDDDTLPHFPEPIGQWATLRKARDESRRARVPCVFIPDPYAEYELRHGLEPGTLANHELRGRVPFDRLLEAATART